MDVEYIWIGDKLPTIYEVAQTIYHYSKAINSEKRRNAVNKYAVAVRNLWIKSFTEKYVVSLTAVKKKINHIMKDYENRVRLGRTSSMRVRNQLWMNMDVPQPKRGPRLNCKNSSLFDLSRNTEGEDGLKGNEKIFYDDQRGERRHLLSQEIDTEYEEERLAILNLQQEEADQLHAELEFIDEDAESIPTASARTVPTERVMTVDLAVDQSCQVDINVGPAIRKVRNTTADIKDAIATVSTKAGISVRKARVATQQVCKKLYGHSYELEVPKEGSDEPPQSKKPRSSKDYKIYENVLPSEKSVNNFKHKKALLQEIIAAKALVSKKETTKVTLHFDTTSRSRIDGDWPSLIFNFKDDDPLECRMISLRPLFFAYEDREQIVSLIVETLKRLSVAANKLNVGASDLWQKIDAVMTDAVSKNLKIEDGVAEQLGSTHVPYHVLCKSHTCERFDSDNLTSLSQIESKIGLRDLLLKREPLLKSFLRSKKSVVEAALEALLKLVAVEGDGKTTSLADLFDLKLEQAGLHKSFSLYKEKRFTRLGYQAGAIYDCIPYLKQVLEETPLNNLLVRACRIYLENDFIIAGFKALANFTYRISMPFLNFIEKTNQNTLVEILPKLCVDLANKKTDTLAEYHVDWTHVEIVKNGPQSDLDHFLLGEMCVQAAIGVELQCKREYWADDSEAETARTTRINNLTYDQRKNLPTNNLNCERYLAKFGYLAAQSAAHSNKLFKGKRIRDDLMLVHGDDNVTIEKSMNETMKNLDDMEVTWSERQKEKKKQRLMDNLQKKVRANDFVDQLLIKCKQHNGPVTSVSELKALVSEKSPELKTFLRQEIQYQRVTHQRDADIRKELYKVNKLSLEEMVENLTVILTDEHEAEDGVIFPCEEEIMEIISGNAVSNKESTQEVENDHSLQPNQPVAVIWDTKNKKRWYIGFFLDRNDDGTYRVDHLERYGACDKIWRRPTGNDDIQDTEEIQILPVNIIGDWDFTADKPTFVLANEIEIQSTFKDVCQLFDVNADA